MNRRSLVLLAISLVLTIVSAAPAACSQGGRTAVRAGVPKPSSEELEGRAPTAEEIRPSVEAAFAWESYAPRSSAPLTIFTQAHVLTVQLFHAGPEHTRTYGYSELQGVPV